MPGISPEPPGFRPLSGPSPARPRRLFPKSLQQASGAIPGPALPGRASAPPSWPPEWPGTARTAADAPRPRPVCPDLESVDFAT